ncbi:LOW QUALITY PROTEIN: melanoma-associated antigen F1 [Rhynchonycteris naso]
MEEAQKRKAPAKARTLKILKVKDQLIADQNPIKKKSFSDHLKQFEKQEVIEGCCKNEESLKKYIEDYVLRTEKGGQIHHALKPQAEEKLKQANEGITQVPSKAQVEALTFQSSSRRCSRRPVAVLGLCSGSHTPQPVHALCTWLPENLLQKPDSWVSLTSQAEGQKDGGQDGETTLPASQEEAEPNLQESPKEDLGALRGGAAEPALTRKVTKGLAVKALARGRAHRRLGQTVAELRQFLLVKDKKKSPITRSEMLKYVIRDLKDVFPEIIARAAERLRYVLGFELISLGKHHTYILINKLKPLEKEEDLGGDVPRLGLLMMILGFIYMKGNSARQGPVWEMLRGLEVCPSKSASLGRHLKRLIMEAFVQQQYLNYTRVPHNSQPECELSWDPQSNLETNKMKFLGFMSKLYKKQPQY